jgi:hypothetical protein
MCVCDTIRTEASFAGWDDYHEFREALRADPAFVQMPVLSPETTVGLLEEWYRCTRCDRTWRLIEPDPPFAGLWRKVEQGG